MNPRTRRLRRHRRNYRRLIAWVREIARQSVRELQTDKCIAKAQRYATAAEVREFLGVPDPFDDPDIARLLSDE